MSITRLLQQASGGSGVSGDPDFADVSLLLDGDGANGANNNTFTDSSSVGATVTPYQMSQGSFSPYAASFPLNMTTSGGSGHFAGSRSYVSLPDNDAYCPEAGDFTLEAWLYTQKQNAYQVIWSKWSAGQQEIFLFIGTTNKLSLTLGTQSSGTTIESTGTIPADQWTHIAVVRNGNALYLYINGTQSGSIAYSGNVPNRSADVYIGDYALQGYYPFDGYISDVRWVKGTAVYTGNFTPPTSPLTATSNTKALLNFQDAGIYDLSGTSDIFTNNSAQVSTSVKKYGTGSLDLRSSKFLGTTTADSFDVGGVFTVEFWVNYASTSGNQTLIDSDATSEFYIAYYSGRIYVANRGSNVLTPLHTPVVGQWYHYAVVCDGSTYKIYVDGQLLETSSTVSSQVIDAWGIGARSNGTSLPSNCYIDDLRITKGVARYTANFTPPTEALPKF